MPRTLIATAVLALTLMPARSASAQTVDLVLGTIVEPAGIKRGDPLKPGDVIRSGPDGLVVFSERWSDEAGYTCVGVTLVGYGASETVGTRATRGRCTPRALSAPAPGVPVVSRGTRYATGKADDPLSAPPDAAASEGAWQEFDQWSRKVSKQGSVMGPLVPGLVYLQGDYRKAPASSAEACASLCASEPQCRAMTFIISQQLCWLKNTVPATATSSDMISAAKR